MPNGNSFEQSKLLELIKLSYTEPAAASQLIAAQPLPRRVVVEIYILIAALSGVTSTLYMFMFPLPDTYELPLILYPLVSAPIQFCIMLGSAALAYKVGAIFGGQGTMEASLKLGAWLYALLFVFDVAGLVALVLPSFIAALLKLAVLISALYLSVAFVMALHGFQNALAVLAGMFATLVLVGFVMTPLFMALGFAELTTAPPTDLLPPS